jgi:hypothetical protein
MNMPLAPSPNVDANYLASAIDPTLDVEIKGPAALLPYHQRCGIRFDSDATVTVILGMCDPQWADASACLAELVVARLGIPLKQVRLFYTGMRPAARRAPLRLARVPNRQNVGVRAAPDIAALNGMHPAEHGGGAEAARRPLQEPSSAAAVGAAGPSWNGGATTIASLVPSMMATSSCRSGSGTLNLSRLCRKSSMNASHSPPVIMRCRWESPIGRPV